MLKEWKWKETWKNNLVLKKKWEKKLYKIFGYEKGKVKKKPGRTILCWKPSSSRRCGGIWRPTTTPGTGLDNISIIITPLKNKSVPSKAIDLAPIQNPNSKYGGQQQHLDLDLTTVKIKQEVGISRQYLSKFQHPFHISHVWHISVYHQIWSASSSASANKK